MPTQTQISFLASLPPWKRAALVNIIGVIGAFVAGLALPDSTPLWVWACSSVLVLLLLNWMLCYRRGKVVHDADRGSRRSTLVIVGTLLLLIADIVWTYFSQR